MRKIIKKRSPKNIELDATGMLKWIQNRCQNASTINAETGTEKGDETHQKSCVSE